MEESVETDLGIRERVTFHAAYGGERVIAYLFLPKGAVPPYQTVVYFPGSGAIVQNRFNLEAGEKFYGFVMKSGRAAVSDLQGHVRAAGRPQV